MVHQLERKKRRYTNPDHRLMIPEFRAPGDPLDAAVRVPRQRYNEVNPGQKTNWR